MNERRATICLLTYGDHLNYLRRCLLSLDRHTPHGEVELRLGFNDATRSFYFALGRLCEGVKEPNLELQDQEIQRVSFFGKGGMPVRMWNSKTNLYKEPMCRLMYHDVPLETEYVIWFDDDSFVEEGWWPELCKLFDKKIDYIGQRWWVFYLPGQVDMIKAQPWYRHIPFQEKEGKPGISFVTGGFMAVRTECIREANFPDIDFTWKGDKLRQYGGDTLLGEIARQLGWTQAVHDKHIKVNVDLNGNHPAPRRGGAGKQFGSDVNVVIQ